MVESAAEQGL